MTDPSFELLKAVLDRLKTDAAVAALVAGRIYDRPADGNATFPYISLGPTDANTEEADDLDQMEITLQVDCWSVGTGEAHSSAEVRKLSGAVRAALHNAEIVLAENALALISHRVTRTLRAGALNHAPVTFTASVEVA